MALPLLSTAAGRATADDATASSPGLWWLAALALLLIAATSFALGTLLARQRAARSLRQARQETQLLAQLQDGWAWQTDAQHGLTQWRAPARAANTYGDTLVQTGAPLWGHFELVADPSTLAPSSLRARLEARLPFADLRVRRITDGSGWMLAAQARLDDDGHFAGHAGTARPTDDDDSREIDCCALHALVTGEPGPALVVGGCGTPERWQLRAANEAAAQLLGGSALTAGMAWHAVLARLPAPLRAAATAIGPGQTVVQGDWRLRHVDLPGANAAALLLTQAAAEPATTTEGQHDSETFSYTISHDLRAPIRVVDGFTRILKEDYGQHLDRVGNDHLDRVLGAAARMNHMIDALLTLARLSSQPLARQPVNLSQLAGYVVDDLRRAAPERQAQIDIEAGMQTQGDPTLLRLVLENLLGNAWKYSANTRKTQIVFATGEHEGRRAYVVRDNGAGFDMRSADRLFGLFQRLHSASDFPGTGVGLASVKRIIRRHGGEIWADAEPGRGASFHFTLRDDA